MNQSAGLSNVLPNNVSLWWRVTQNIFKIEVEVDFFYSILQKKLDKIHE